MTVFDFLCYLDDLGFDVARAVNETAEHSLEDLPVMWNSRLKTTAGRACYFKRIELNPQLKIEGKKAIYTTFLHELAHLIAGPAAGHGPVWKLACIWVGLKNETRCHSYSSMKQRVPKVVAVCEDCGARIYRRKKLDSSRLWSHSTCGGKLRLQ